MSFKLKIERSLYTETTTSGKMYLDGEYFGYTLEDASRGENVKIPGKTCIPTGTYKVKVTFSNRFQRDMPMIYTEDNGYELKNKGVSFKGVRIHGGNTHVDTHGCPLIAKNFVNAEHIYGSLESELTEKLKELGGEGSIEVVNL